MGTDKEDAATIEISDDEGDVVIDVGELEKIPIDYIFEWDTEVRHRFAQFAIADNDKVLIDLMTEYIESLDQMAKKFEEFEALRVKMMCHIMFLHSYFGELDTPSQHEYLDKMEKILTIYCNLELEGIYNIKKLNLKKKEQKLQVFNLCKKISHILTVFLYNREEYIFHVLIRLNTSTDYHLCKYFLDTIYKYFLSKCVNYDDESFCRCYILFQKWKQLRDKSEWSKMDTLMYKLSKREPGCIEKDEFLRRILMPKSNSLTDVVFKVFGSCRDLSKTYFDYMSSKKGKEAVQIQETELNLDKVEEALLTPESLEESVDEIDDEDKVFEELEAALAEVRVKEMQTMVQCKQEPDDDEGMEIDNNYVNGGLNMINGSFQCKVERESDEDEDDIEVVAVATINNKNGGFLDSIEVDLNGLKSVAKEGVSVVETPTQPEEQPSQPATTPTTTTTTTTTTIIANDDPLSEFSKIVEQSESIPLTNLTQLNDTDLLSEMDKFTNNSDKQFYIGNNNGDIKKELLMEKSVKCLYEYGITTPPSENVIRSAERCLTFGDLDNVEKTTEELSMESSNEQYNVEIRMEPKKTDYDILLSTEFDDYPENTLDEAMDSFLEDVRQQNSKKVLEVIENSKISENTQVNDNIIDNNDYEVEETVKNNENLNLFDGTETVDGDEFKIKIQQPKEINDDTEKTPQDILNSECLIEETMEEDQFCSQKNSLIIENKNNIVISNNNNNNNNISNGHLQPLPNELSSPEYESIADIGKYYSDMLQSLTSPPPPPLEAPPSPSPAQLPPKLTPIPSPQLPSDTHLEAPSLLPVVQPTPQSSQQNISPTNQQLYYNNNETNLNGVKEHIGILKKNGQKSHKNGVAFGENTTHYIEKVGNRRLHPHRTEQVVHVQCDVDDNEEIEEIDDIDDDIEEIDGIEELEEMYDELQEMGLEERRVTQKRIVEVDTKFSMTPIVKLTRNIFVPRRKPVSRTPQRAVRVDYRKSEQASKNSVHLNHETAENTGPLDATKLKDKKSTSNKANGSLGSSTDKTSPGEKRKDVADNKNSNDYEPKAKKKAKKRVEKKRSNGNNINTNKEEDSNPVDNNKQLINGVRHYDKPFRDFFDCNNDKT